VTKVIVNGREVEVPHGATVLQACEIGGAEIPRFCYHDRLKIAGNCRMCLVEVEKSPKPVASCAMPTSEGMIIHTDSQLVKDAREGVMEFLLINHPLDCPICDQGGECDLQDQAMAYGKSCSSYNEDKRAVENKNLGPLISTHMTRCIHCTRCIRFITDVAGVPELGAVGRGEHMEVTTYVEKALTSELSANIVDLCPVGALTSKPFAYKARSWELSHMESIDVTDALGANIRIDYKGREVMRILPKNNDDINEEWISDKARFSYDGLMNQRLDIGYIRKNNRLLSCSVEDAVAAVSNYLRNTNSQNIAALVGDLVDVETTFVFKDLLEKSGVINMDCRIEGEKFDPSNRFTYLFNTTISGIEKSDACLIIGSNTRKDSPVLNARIRAKYHHGHYPIGVIGCDSDLTYKYDNLGQDLAVLDEILEGKSFGKTLENAKNPLVIVGVDAAKREDGDAIIAKAMEIAEKYNAVRPDFCGFSILNRAAGRVGAMEVGFVPGPYGKDFRAILRAIETQEIQLLFLIGVDNLHIQKNPGTVVVYVGHHGDRGAEIADIILPGAAYTEKDGIYVNLEGRPQYAFKAVSAPGLATDDRMLALSIAAKLGIDLGYKSLGEIRSALYNKYPKLLGFNPEDLDNWIIPPVKRKTLPLLLQVEDYNFYLTNAISRASKVMVQCSKEMLKHENLYSGASC
jgi:NADH-quinone oxidoreductase subunit G